jgi:Flp pilus assembly pilin Flp
MRTVEASQRLLEREGLILKLVEKHLQQDRHHTTREREPQRPGGTMTNIRIARQFVSDESGQDMIEYVLVAAVISLGCVTVFSPLAHEVGTLIASVVARFSAVA